MNNKNIYESKSSLKEYLREEDLQLPEKEILKKLATWLKNKKILDIGVGGGRTTKVIAHYTNDYTGIDYIDTLIDECINKFSQDHELKHAKFLCIDARNLEHFHNEEFDFIIFSFNGIDYCSTNDRRKILISIHRILKPGGFFVFSTHNTISLKNLFSNNRLFKKILKNLLFFLLNGTMKKHEHRSFSFIFDGAFNFKLKTYYCQPSFQIKELTSIGYNNFELYGYSDGKKIHTTNIERINDPWIYFLCQKPTNENE